MLEINYTDKYRRGKAHKDFRNMTHAKGLYLLRIENHFLSLSIPHHCREKDSGEIF